MLNKKFSLILLPLVLVLTGCHQRVEPVSNLDRQMSCREIKNEIQKTENIKKEISSNRGVSGRNAIGLLFWPSIVINEVTGESAEKEANTRLLELKNIYAAKQCHKKVS